MHPGFTLTRTPYGTVVLRFGLRTVPANDAYVERLLAERGIVISPDETRATSPDLVKEILEEALGGLGHQLRSLEAMKREILRYCLIADEKAVA